MPPEDPVASSAEDMNAEDVSRSPSHAAAIPTTDIAPENEKEMSHAKGSMDDDNAMHNSLQDGVTNDAAFLEGVRSSLQTMSNGIDELSTTVRDMLGLDSDGDSFDDYEHGSDGERGQLSWAKLKYNARRRRRARNNMTAARVQTNLSGDESETDDGPKMSPQIIPGIRECNVDHFFSRPEAASEIYCIETLVAGDEFGKDIRQFFETVNGIRSGKLQHWKPGNVSDATGESSSESTGKKWTRSIRINSRIVMELLHVLTGGRTGRRARPTVFRRPFQLLVSLHDTVKERLVNMTNFASGGHKEVEDVIKSGSIQGDGYSKFIWNLRDNKHAIDEITCFVDFMESRIMTDALRFRDPLSIMPKSIRYEDLWYLFKPGDLVYIPRDTSGRDIFRSSPASQQFLRVTQTSLMRFERPSIGSQLYHGPWCIHGHFIEHDGSSYSPVRVSRTIPAFEGEKKITELPIYPIAYLDDTQVIQQARADGETYISLIERRSGFYSGWTQTVDPLGARITESSLESQMASPQHIESQILVDFRETFNAFPSWKPDFDLAEVPDVGPNGDFPPFNPVEAADWPILTWDEMGMTKEVLGDLYLENDPIEEWQAGKFMRQDPLGQFRRTARGVPTGEFLALLPRRFFGYAVLERKFVQLDTRFVRSAELEANDKAFENLEINRIYKQLILALVKSHFDKVETEKKRNVEIESQDLIRGKGKGVVILLHGVPGVGKTATAEAVALKWKKPLFPITCGDLGYTAESLEKSLNEIFRLAHHWGCILLLDEADVFITQRERHDLKRNALVSAFLRVLEYYNGIMFLTTNRAGVLDEAIKSRVHLNLYYDHLTEDQTVAIFRQHIQRLRNIERQRNPDPNEQIMVLHKEILQFARDHFNQRGNSQGLPSSFGRWNGRQIRNAFLIASSLAHYDSEEEGDADNDDLAEQGRKKQKQLGRSQFELVAQTTLMYDQYRQSVHSGKSDDHVAFEREERAMSSQQRSPTPVRMRS